VRRFIQLSFLTALIPFLISPALSQDLSQKLSLGLQSGLWKPGLTEHSDIYTVGDHVGLSFKYYLKEKISLRFSATYGETGEADLSGREGEGAGFTFSQKENSNRLRQVWLDADLIYHLRPFERLNPYVLGGVGLTFWSVKDKDGNLVKVQDVDLKDQELTFAGGGGLEYRLKEKWGVSLGTRFHYLSHVLTSFTGSKDIVGTGPDELDLPRATLEVFLGVNYYFGRVKDTDKDNVPDREDYCPDTPRGSTVDERGCPQDSDGDGIYDGLDKCPHTPPGTKVNANGCPL